MRSNSEIEKQDREYRLLGMRIVYEFGFSIAIPVVVLALGGKKLDEKFGTAPILLILSFVLAALLSAIIVYRKAKHFGKLYKEIDTKKD